MLFKEIIDRMHTGKLYFCNDEQLIKEQQRMLDKLYDYNHTRPSEVKKRETLLEEMFAEIGEGCYIEPPFHANWGGKHIHFGNNVYANFNLTMVDDTHIYVGDNVLFGPGVIVCTGTHPAHPELRRKQAQYNLPVHIGKNVWIGGGAFIMPGITIGENSIIGANSVVTKDIPPDVIAVGNPCRVLRTIDEKDRQFYDRGKVIDVE